MSGNADIIMRLTAAFQTISLVCIHVLWQRKGRVLSDVVYVSLYRCTRKSGMWCEINFHAYARGSNWVQCHVVL